MRTRTPLLLLALVVVGVGIPSTPANAQTAIFRFESDEFWLNLHKYLYVLGRAQNKSADASREAVAGAPADADRGLASLTEGERKTWADAVTVYAQGLSRRDPIFDRDLALLEGRLAVIDSAPLVEGTNVDASLRAVLERAAPVYRKAWWPSHVAANRAWVSSTEQLLKAQGPAVLQFITRAYSLPWPAGGYPVHVVHYALWAGAYSTYGDLLVVSSNSAAGMSGWSGLETVFHEGMHTWDDAIAVVLNAEVQATGRELARNLSHAIVFYTAGEAVRRVAPAGYVPLADATGGWQRGMTGLKPALEEIWLPYLNGRGTRDATLAALVRRTTSPPFNFRTDDFWLNLHHFLYLTRAYGIDWPAAGRQIRLTAYANFGGGYSLVNGGLIILSSVNPGSQGVSGLEAIFHESLHQWDPQTVGALGEHAKKINVMVPRDLPHAMIFFTAGEAVRRVSPDYVPLVDTLGIWQLNLSGASLPASRLRQPLIDTWKPYLDGRGTREAALASLLAQAAAASSR